MPNHPPSAPHLFAVFDGNGNFTAGVARSEAEAERAVLAKIRADYSEFDGCPVAYDADACGEFAVSMGDGMTWTIQPVALPEYRATFEPWERRGAAIYTEETEPGAARLIIDLHGKLNAAEVGQIVTAHNGAEALNPNHRQCVEAMARAMVGLQIPLHAFDLDHLTARERAAFNAAWNAATLES